MSPRVMPSAGAAMCTPTRTRPSARWCTEKASSISVVLTSSMENACTSASGKSSGRGGIFTGAKPVPCGKNSERKRASCNARADGIPPHSSIRRACEIPRAAAPGGRGIERFVFDGILVRLREQTDRLARERLGQPAGLELFLVARLHESLLAFLFERRQRHLQLFLRGALILPASLATEIHGR